MNKISRAAQLLVNQGALPDDFDIIQITGFGVLGYSESHDMIVMWTTEGAAYKCDSHYNVDEYNCMVYWSDEENRPAVLSPLVFKRDETLDIKL